MFYRSGILWQAFCCLGFNITDQEYFGGSRLKRARMIPSGNKVSSAKDIGSLVRFLRKEMNITQAQAAGLCDVGVRFLSDLENGKPTLQIDKVIRVLNGFGIQVNLSRRGL